MKSVTLITTILALVAMTRATRSHGTDTLTVVTLNLWHDQRDWPKRLSVILAEMRALRPDILCLQEVLQHSSLRNQAATLADSLGYRMHFTSVDSVHREKRYGNAILTRHPALRSGGKDLDPPNDYRTVAHVRIDFQGRVVDVYDTHLHHTPEGGSIRATQIRDLLAFVDSTRGDGAVVLAGDFNARLETPEMQLVAADFVDAFKTLHPSATLRRRRHSTRSSEWIPGRSITSSCRGPGRRSSRSRARSSSGVRGPTAMGVRPLRRGRAARPQRRCTGTVIATAGGAIEHHAAATRVGRRREAYRAGPRSRPARAPYCRDRDHLRGPVIPIEAGSRTTVPDHAEPSRGVP